MKTENNYTINWKINSPDKNSLYLNYPFWINNPILIKKISHLNTLIQIYNEL